jgi:hypothetical protein
MTKFVKPELNKNCGDPRKTHTPTAPAARRGAAWLVLFVPTSFVQRLARSDATQAKDTRDTAKVTALH